MLNILEAKINDVNIMALQDIAHNLLNGALNYSTPLKLFFLSRCGNKAVSDRINLDLRNALELLQNCSFLLGFFDLFQKSMNEASIHDSFANFFMGLSDLIEWRKGQGSDISTEIPLSNIPFFIPGELKFINPENACLEHIAALFEENRDLFKLAFINGSLGSNDYIPGWSDVDIFAVVSRDALKSNAKFCRLLQVSQQIKKEIFSYNRIQVHSVFYSWEDDLLFYRYHYFPADCLKRGKLLVSHEKTCFLYGSQIIQKQDANKLYCEAFDHFKYLRSKKNKSLLEKVLLIHRLFLFPIFYLSTKGINCYKRDSFDLLMQYLTGHVNIDDFCSNLKVIYRGMTIQYSHSFHLRRFFMNVADPQLVNNFSLRLGSRQSAGIARVFDLISDKGLFEEAESYWSFGLAELKKEGVVI